jgi:hypothetical protein
MLGRGSGKRQSGAAAYNLSLTCANLYFIPNVAALNIQTPVSYALVQQKDQTN